MRRSATTRSVTAAARAAVLLFAATGCTICPDPFDYSGPVPDGSVPQNDFRARAKGILAPGSHPVPWPPVVQAVPRRGDDARDVTVGADAEEAAPGVAKPADARSAAAADAPPDAHPADDQPAVVMPTAADVPATAADRATDEVVGPPEPQPLLVEEPSLEDVLPPVPAWQETLPRLRETPGWKPRG